MVDVLKDVNIFDAIQPPNDPHEEWVRQANFLAYNFAKPLGYDSKARYIDELLPSFFEQPVSWQGKFDFPFLVQVPMGNLTLVMMADILEITFYADAYKAEEWSGNPQELHKIGRPYSTYLGLTDTNVTLEEVRANLPTHGRAGNVLDTMMLYRRFLNPNILERFSLDVSGSEVVVPGSSPYGLYLNNLSGERPTFYCRSTDFPLPNSVSVVGGRQILTK